MPIAYSYIRFSSPKQEHGDSIRRQTKLAVDYAAKHGLTLSDETYEDKGVSAFRGKNIAEGRLAVLLRACQSGAIPKGSYLLVESLDRLSRDKVRFALKHFLSIIEHDITIVTLLDEQVFSAERVDSDNGISLIISITVMARAHEESASRSKRIRALWKGKLDSGAILTSICPAWLKLVEGKWVPQPEKVAVIKEVFALANKGYGTPSIARQLNAKGVGTLGLGRAWSFKTVAKLLHDTAVIGEFTPKTSDQGGPIPKYYPQVISDAVFYKAQEGMRSRFRAGGARDDAKNTNILAGVLFCRRCGNRVGVMGARGKYMYLRCASAHAGSGCKEGRVPYRPVEVTVLVWLRKEIEGLVAQASAEVEDPQVTLKAELVEQERRLGNYLDSLADVKSPDLVRRINEAQTKVDELKAKLAQVVPVATQHEALGEAAELIRKLKVRDLDSLTREERMQLRGAVRRLVEKIAVWTDGRQKFLAIFNSKYSSGWMGEVLPQRRSVRTST